MPALLLAMTLAAGQTPPTDSASPNAGQPATAKGTRLLQMRQIVRRFAVTIAEPGDDGVHDGALFAFAHGTDPELMLMIEAVQRDGDRAWRFAVVRSNHLNMWMTYEGDEVWRVDRITPYSIVRDPTEPYCQLKRTRVEVEAADEALAEEVEE